MRNNLFHKIPGKFWFYFWLLLPVIFLGSGLAAQDSNAKITDTVTAATEEPAAAEEPELISPLIDFISVQKSDNTIDLKATLKAKIDGSLTRLGRQTIIFYTITGEEERVLGEVKTDRNGMAILKIRQEGLVADTGGKLQFRISFAGTKTIEAGEEVLGIKRARLLMEAIKEDSVYNLNFTLVDLSSGTEVPVPAVAIQAYVKRLFNPLKVGEGETDESGLAVLTLPGDLPGDAKGMLTIMGRVEENEEYGNLEAVVTEKWGVPVSDQFSAMPRALWSPNPPVWMLVTFFVLMTIVWGHYFVIIYELFRLKGEH